MGRTRCGAGGYGAGDSDVPSGCTGGAVFRDPAGWTWASPGFEHPDERGVPGGSGPEAVSRADRAGAPTVASEETLHRKCVRLWSDDVSGCELDGKTEYGRAERGSGRVVCAVCDAGIAASTVAGCGELECRAGRPVYVLQAGGFDRARQEIGRAS